jgi:hypothetical protein
LLLGFAGVEFKPGLHAIHLPDGVQIDLGGVAQILIPFISPYRPVWVGVGVIAFWLILLVSTTFYIRSRITMKAFRVINAGAAGYMTKDHAPDHLAEAIRTLAGGGQYLGPGLAG